MATLDELNEEESEGAVHLLLVGPSKAGKTRYIIELIKDGFEVLYIDNDNGLSTLRRGLLGNKEAMSRVHYVKTQNIWNFCVYFFARDKFQWNETQDEIFSERTAAEDDKILQLYRKQIPMGVVLVIDSWTSVKTQLMLDSAKKNNVSYEVFNEQGMAVYGDASRRADVMLMNLQAHPGHVIVQAHQEQYEILEKPKGQMSESTKMKNLIMKDNVTVPMSVSRPHGFAMSKFFNEVGWLRISPMGKFVLDFQQKADRVGGGSPMAEGDPMTAMRFSTLFAKPRPVQQGWIRTVPVAELRAEAEESARIAAEAKAATAANTTAKASPTPSLPGKSLLGNMTKTN